MIGHHILLTRDIKKASRGKSNIVSLIKERRFPANSRCRGLLVGEFSPSWLVFSWGTLDSLCAGEEILLGDEEESTYAFLSKVELRTPKQIHEKDTFSLVGLPYPNYIITAYGSKHVPIARERMLDVVAALEQEKIDCLLARGNCIIDNRGEYTIIGDGWNNNVAYASPDLRNLMGPLYYGSREDLSKRVVSFPIEL